MQYRLIKERLLREGIARTVAAIRDGAPYDPALVPPFVAAGRA